MGADARIETDALDDCLRVETFHFSVCIELIEIAYSQCKIGIGEEFHCLGFFHAHEERGYAFGILCIKGCISIGFGRMTDGSFHQKGCEVVCFLLKHVNVGNFANGFVLIGELADELRIADDDSRWIEVIIESLALAEEFRREQKVEMRNSLQGIVHI